MGEGELKNSLQDVIVQLRDAKNHLVATQVQASQYDAVRDMFLKPLARSQSHANVLTWFFGVLSILLTLPSLSESFGKLFSTGLPEYEHSHRINTIKENLLSGEYEAAEREAVSLSQDTNDPRESAQATYFTSLARTLRGNVQPMTVQPQTGGKNWFVDGQNILLAAALRLREGKIDEAQRVLDSIDKSAELKRFRAHKFLYLAESSLLQLHTLAPNYEPQEKVAKLSKLTTNRIQLAREALKGGDDGDVWYVNLRGPELLQAARAAEQIQSQLEQTISGMAKAREQARIQHEMEKNRQAQLEAQAAEEKEKVAALENANIALRYAAYTRDGELHSVPGALDAAKQFKKVIGELGRELQVLQVSNEEAGKGGYGHNFYYAATEAGQIVWQILAARPEFRSFQYERNLKRRYADFDLVLIVAEK